MVATLGVKRIKHKKIPLLPDSPSRVKVGFPAGRASGSNIEKAIWNEFGTSRGIPERPFMRNAMRNNKGKYLQALRAAAKQIIAGTMSMTTALNRFGIMAQADIQGEITSLNTPPNAPATIRRKGSSKPLIDTGAMRQAVTWMIE